MKQKTRKPSPTESPLLFELDPEPLPETPTALGGVPLFDVLNNEPAAGVMPSKYFGTNATWLWLAVIARNVLTAQKRLALPAELLTARPKQLRLLIFYTPGRRVHHARRLVLRSTATAARLAEWLESMRLLPLRV